MGMYHGMDLSAFKKVKSDNQSTTLRHAKGHEIRIAHKALTPKLKGMLDGLQMFAGGGEAMDDESPATADDGPEDATLTNQAPGEPPTDAIPEASTGDPLGLDNQPNATPESSGLPPGNMITRPGVEGAPPRNSINAPPINVRDSYFQDDAPPDVITEAAKPSATPKLDDMNQESVKEFQDQGKVDPKTTAYLFAKKDTPGKIGLILGMLLSGAGSGLAHQHNALLDMLNKELDRDLDAQKNSNTNAQNWYNLNQHHQMNKAGIKEKNANTDILAGTAAHNQMKNYVMLDAINKQKLVNPDQAASAADMLQRITDWHGQGLQSSNAEAHGKLSLINANNEPNYDNGIDNDKVEGAAMRQSFDYPGAATPQAYRDQAALIKDNRQTRALHEDAFRQLDNLTANQLGEAAGMGAEAVGPAMVELTKAMGKFGPADALAHISENSREILRRLDQKRDALIAPIMGRIGQQATGSVAEGSSQKIEDAKFPTIFDLASGDTEALRAIKWHQMQKFYQDREAKLAPDLSNIDGAIEPFSPTKYKAPQKEKASPSVVTARAKEEAAKAAGTNSAPPSVGAPQPSR